MNKAIQTIQNLNLNVVLITCIASVAFYKLPLGHNSIYYPSVILLGLITWSIYLLDRILDNYKQFDQTSTSRHQFHKKHEFNLILFVISLLIISTILAFFMPKSIIFCGLIIVFMVMLYYFLIQKIGKYYKEFLMPFIYCAAVIGIPFSLKSSINLSSWVLAGVFFLVVVQNMLCFSIFEKKSGEAGINFLDKVSVFKATKIVNYICSFNVFIGIYLFTDLSLYSNKLGLSFMAISLFNALSVVYVQKLIINESYRLLLDSLFFIILISFI